MDNKFPYATVFLEPGANATAIANILRDRGLAQYCYIFPDKKTIDVLLDRKYLPAIGNMRGVEKATENV